MSNIEIKCSEMNGSIGWAEGKARFGRDLKNSCKSSAHLMKLYRFASPSSLVCKLIHLVFPLFAPTLLASLERWVLQKISPPTEILPEYGSLALDTQHNAPPDQRSTLNLLLTHGERDAKSDHADSVQNGAQEQSHQKPQRLHLHATRQ